MDTPSPQLSVPPSFFGDERLASTFQLRLFLSSRFPRLYNPYDSPFYALHRLPTRLD